MFGSESRGSSILLAWGQPHGWRTPFKCCYWGALKRMINSGWRVTSCWPHTQHFVQHDPGGDRSWGPDDGCPQLRDPPTFYILYTWKMVRLTVIIADEEGILINGSSSTLLSRQLLRKVIIHFDYVVTLESVQAWKESLFLTLEYLIHKTEVT